MNPLFTRNFSQTFDQDAIDEVISKLEAIHTFNKFNIHTYIKKYGKDICDFCAWQIVKKWIYLNQRFTYEFINNLKYLLKIFKLSESLNANEKQFISYYENIIFAQNRNWKNLIVDFDLYDNTEQVYFKYNVLLIRQDEKLNVFDKSEIYLSTKRIIFSNKNTYCYIMLKDIESIKLTTYSLDIKTSNMFFQIYSEDLHFIFVSLERILKILGIHF